MRQKPITEFHSDIIIQTDAEMQVTETITVNAEGQRIKRGIYRDFPTRYRDRMNNNYTVGFEVKTLLRNGYSEDYHLKPMSNGVRVYFGHQERTLNRGLHEYLLRYTSNRQLGFFDKHDELYWNVTGNDWEFPIQNANATIHLPEGVPRESIQLEAYTGRMGATGQAYEAYLDFDNTVHFHTTQPLQPGEGLTIVVSFAKGFVVQPSWEQELAYLFRDNRHLIYASIGMVILLMYYWISWLLVGKDPESGVVIPLYHPPKDYSPASMRFIEKMTYDNTSFSSAILNLAVKGYLTIKQNKNNDYVLEKTGTEVEMAAGESALAKALFSKDTSVTLKQFNHALIRKTINSHKASLKNDYEWKYFIKNTGYFVIGILISILILATLFFSQPGYAGSPETMFIIFWLTPWTLVCMGMLKNAWNHFTSKNYSGAMGALAMLAPFLFFEIMALFFFLQMTSLSVVMVLIAVCVINWLFYEWLKKPTLRGRKLLDKVEGFREYIELAEKHELDYKYPKGKCPELFELYLPYALALEVEDSWARQFAEVIKQSGADQDYQPSWYHGRAWNHTKLTSFTSSLNSSLGSAISSSSTAPGSSSGSGGGGFSGGGGGGGGGGGW